MTHRHDMENEHTHTWEQCPCIACESTPGLVYVCPCNAEKHMPGSYHHTTYYKNAGITERYVEYTEPVILYVNYTSI